MKGIIIDVETSTGNGVVNATKNKLKFFAYENLDTGECGILRESQREAIQRVLSDEAPKIGYNTKGYDNIVLELEGYTISGVQLDLYEIIKKRSNVLRLLLNSYSLNNVCKALHLEVKEDNMNYAWLDSEESIQEHLEEIVKYTEQDINITKALWEYLENYFTPFQEYLTKAQNTRYQWLTSSIAAYAYKVICNKAGLKEEYADDTDREHYEGGLVTTPTKELAKGNIILFDYASLYPNLFFNCNLFSHRCTCCEEKDKWRGNGLYETKNAYCTKKLGRIESAIKELYQKRVLYKKARDSREYVIKIIINALYGASGSPIFKNLHNYNSASDCTGLARACLQHAQTRFKDFDFEVLYGDTDSVFVQIPKGKSETQAKHVASLINKELLSRFPFADDNTFGLKIDDEISMAFFPGLKKKHYLYVNKENELTMKGFALIKRGSSRIGKAVFENLLVPYITSTHNPRMRSEVIKSEVARILKEDITMATVTWKTKPVEYYKLSSQMQSQISRRHGVGVHALIPNLKGIGVGIGKHYCTVKEFQDAGLDWRHVDLSKVYSELEPFSDAPLKQSWGNGVTNTLEEWA